MDTAVEKTVKSIVNEDFRAASVFEKYSIDFCCHGNVPLSEACAQKGVDQRTVLSELARIGSSGNGEAASFKTLDLDTIVDHIIRRHHAYIRKISPTIIAHTQKIASVHGKNHPELIDVAERILSITSDMANHMMKEERVLFPYIKGLAAAARGEEEFQPAPFGSIANPIRMMEAEHERAGDTMGTIRSETDEYNPPEDACTTYRVTLQELQEFERDLHSHVHLENNILFPRAIALEKRFGA
jgi:regulator of cell morphogenesis and NO signaling